MLLMMLNGSGGEEANTREERGWEINEVVGIGTSGNRDDQGNRYIYIYLNSLSLSSLSFSLSLLFTLASLLY